MIFALITPPPGSASLVSSGRAPHLETHWTIGRSTGSGLWLWRHWWPLPRQLVVCVRTDFKFGVHFEDNSVYCKYVFGEIAHVSWDTSLGLSLMLYGYALYCFMSVLCVWAIRTFECRNNPAACSVNHRSLYHSCTVAERMLCIGNYLNK